MVEAGSLALTVPCLEEEEDVLHRALQATRVRTGVPGRGRRFGSSFGLRAGSRSGDWRAAFRGGMSRRDADQLAWN